MAFQICKNSRILKRLKFVKFEFSIYDISWCFRCSLTYLATFCCYQKRLLKLEQAAYKSAGRQFLLNSIVQLRQVTRVSYLSLNAIHICILSAVCLMQ